MKKKLNKQFSFEYIPKSDIKNDILNLDVSKTSQDSDIPTKIIKVTRVHKKGRCLHKQISDFFDTILSKYQCGFRNGHGAQHCLIAHRLTARIWYSSN